MSGGREGWVERVNFPILDEYKKAYHFGVGGGCGKSIESPAKSKGLWG